MSSGYQQCNMEISLTQGLAPEDVLDPLAELHRLQDVLKEYFPGWHVVNARIDLEALL